MSENFEQSRTIKTIGCFNLSLTLRAAKYYHYPQKIRQEQRRISVACKNLQENRKIKDITQQEIAKDYILFPSYCYRFYSHLDRSTSTRKRNDQLTKLPREKNGADREFKEEETPGGSAADETAGERHQQYRRLLLVLWEDAMEGRVLAQGDGELVEVELMASFCGGEALEPLLEGDGTSAGGSLLLPHLHHRCNRRDQAAGDGGGGGGHGSPRLSLSYPAGIAERLHRKVRAHKDERSKR